MKSSLILLILLVPLVSAVGYNNPYVPGLQKSPTTIISGNGSSSSVNVTGLDSAIGNATYWKLDGSNHDSVSANWEMGSILGDGNAYNMTASSLISWIDSHTPKEYIGGAGAYVTDSSGNLILHSTDISTTFESSIVYGQPTTSSTPFYSFTSAPDTGIGFDGTVVNIIQGGATVCQFAGGTARCYNTVQTTNFVDGAGTLPQSDKMVTTNTQQTISANKVFSLNVTALNFIGNGSYLTSVCLSNGTNCKASTGGDNASWNESYAYTKFYNKTGDIIATGYNMTIWNITAGGRICDSVGCIGVSGTGDNVSWNESYARNIFAINSTTYNKAQIEANLTLYPKKANVETISGLWTFTQNMTGQSGTFCMGTASNPTCSGYRGFFFSAQVPHWGATYPAYNYLANDFADGIPRIISSMSAGGLQNWNFINDGGTTVGGLAYSAGTGGSDIQFVDGSGNFKGGVGAVSTTSTGVFIGANNGLGGYNSIHGVEVYQTNVTSLLKTYISTNLSVNNNVNITGNVFIGGNLSVKRPYAMFSDNTTQPITATATAYPVNFSTTEVSYLVNKNANKQNITVLQNGDYLVEISAVFTTAVPNKHVEIWVQKNGINVPRSNTKTHLSNANAEQVVAVPFVIPLNTSDNMRIMWASDDTGMTMTYTTNTSYSPEVPSIIMTMTKISELSA